METKSQTSIEKCDWSEKEPPGQREFRPGGRPCVNSLNQAISTGLGKLIFDFVELSRSVGTNSFDCCQADDDDQSEHHCVFNCCWSVFRNKKFLYTVCQVSHLYSPLSKFSDRALTFGRYGLNSPDLELPRVCQWILIPLWMSSVSDFVCHAKLKTLKPRSVIGTRKFFLNVFSENCPGTANHLLRHEVTLDFTSIPKSFVVWGNCSLGKFNLREIVTWQCKMSFGSIQCSLNSLLRIWAACLLWML